MSVVLGGGGHHEADVVVAQDLGGEDLEDVADDPEEGINEVETIVLIVAVDIL